jgi:hypothetical protein
LFVDSGGSISGLTSHNSLVTFTTESNVPGFSIGFILAASQARSGLLRYSFGSLSSGFTDALVINLTNISNNQQQLPINKDLKNIGLFTLTQAKEATKHTDNKKIKA